MRRGGAVNPAEEEQKQSDRCMQSSGAREWTATEHRFTSTCPGVDVAKRIICTGFLHKWCDLFFFLFWSKHNMITTILNDIWPLEQYISKVT